MKHKETEWVHLRVATLVNKDILVEVAVSNTEDMCCDAIKSTQDFLQQHCEDWEIVDMYDEKENANSYDEVIHLYRVED